MDSTTHIRVQFRVGYADQTTTTGAAYVSAAVSQISSWNVGLTLGAALNKNWELGVGFEYRHQKMKTMSELYLPFSNEQVMAQQQTETKVSLPVFSLYSAYYIHLSNRFYFTPRLEVGYGQATEKNTAVTETVTLYRTDEFDYFSPGKSGKELRAFSPPKYDCFAMQLSPELRYFLSDNIGVSLGLGGVQLSLVDWEWDSKQWIANFNPAYWKLGMVVAF
ncbi:hypothetical protein AGMMS4957_20710 [Bacteroidia bacterium]|nr:hypothetical protein AGMMS4957_20710 [Bacteroidia bacterium]